ncbi:site-specific DNA-methyltransferase [bacterium]|nr:site-specific DNA-methyltransferase [bacterium]
MRKAELPWSFSDLTQQQTGYITHGYHRYPAKFIPQVAARLIAEHSQPGDTVLDPFMGSGTTLVEALVAGRKARGVDINPAAIIASRAKTTPIDPERLRVVLEAFTERLAGLASGSATHTPLIPGNQERLDFWFPRDQQQRLGLILALIEDVADAAVRGFLRCAFSHALKNASVWLMKSSKPTRDKAKMANGVPDPGVPLRRHLRKMERANAKFWELLPESFRRKPAADVQRGDARKLPWRANTVHLVVTSPPYVTSYEYADLHQLTNQWLGELADIAATKDQFIGSAAARNRGAAEANSPLARQTVAALRSRSTAKAEEVRQYFLDMEDVFRECHRVLRPGGVLCNVIGNTALGGVDVLNAEVHAETKAKLGFEIVDVIKRVIPSKTLPQVRDPKTGKFTSSRAGSVEAYPEEFILVCRKA